jgi:CubicO group peptidase (beta-lactamase class C family)
MIPPLPLCLAALLLATPFLRAEELEDVKALLEPIRAKHHLPALTAAVVIDGRLVAVGTTGVRAFGHLELAMNGDRWHIGSCTKSMTGALAGMLVEEGKIHWDTTVGAALPQLAASLQADYKKVTLEQLLTHRSGAPSKPPDALWAVARARIGTPQQQRLAFVMGLVRRGTEAPPGTKFIYSNQGFAIAGAMLERAAGMPYEQLLEQRLFAPLELKSAGFGAPGTAGRIDQPRGHNLINGLPDPVEPGPEADNPPALAPAAGVNLSITDFARYAAWHADGRTLLQPDTFAKLHTPISASGHTYAMGLSVRESWPGGTVLTHVGTNTHFWAVMWIVPTRHAAFVAVGNLGGDPSQAGPNEAIMALVAKFLP